MTQIIHIAAETEPTALHGAQGAVEVFGAHLAVEFRDETEEDAKILVEQFLQSLSGGTFQLLTIDGTNTVPTELTRLYAIPADEDQSFDAAKTMAWLNDAKHAFVKLANGIDTDPTDDQMAKYPFYTSMASADRNLAQAGAVDLLRATAKWPAPLAQDVGLTVPLSRNAALDNTKVNVIVYLPAGVEPGDVTFTVTDIEDPVSLAVKQDGNTLFELSTGKVLPYSDVSDLFADSGVFKTPTDSDTLARLLTRIEEHAPSLLTASTLLDDVASDPAVIANIAGLSGPDALEDDTELPADLLRWLRQAIIVALFDVPLIALAFFDPAENKSLPAQPKGAILQRLSRLIAGFFEPTALESKQELDETILYRMLHMKLQTELTFASPNELWTTMGGVLPGTSRVDTIAKAMEAGQVETTTWKKWQESQDKFLNELAELAVFLESETGAEAWVLSRCDKAFLNSISGIFEVNLTAAGLPPTQGDTAVKLTELYLAFRREIMGGFNGSEAMRRDFGALVVARLTKAANGGTPENITNLLNSSNWFQRRLVEATGAAVSLDDLIERCVPLAAPLSGMPMAVSQALSDGYADRAAQITGQAAATKGRFVPDPSPLPLPVRIAKSIDPAEIDKISGRISGLGFLVRARAHKNDGTVDSDDTRHASLVALANREATPKDLEVEDSDIWLSDPAFLPTLPVLSPGASGLFVQYGGAPLASPNRATPARGGADMDADQLAQANAEKQTRGFQVDDSWKSAKLPALAYGREYAVSAFWVPNSGVLPGPLRAEATAPFTPGPPSGDFIPAVETLKPYQRRTAISDTAVTATGAIPEGVFPLALDDPRLVLESFEGGARHLDLFRRPDGAGGLVAPEDEIALYEVSFSGGLSIDHLRVEAMSPDEQPFELTDQIHCKETRCLTIPLSGVTEMSAVWLRLCWGDDAPTGGCLSFDVPTMADAPDNHDRQAKVVLLAPSAKDWIVETEQTITFDGPCVSFADFECWARNTRLWREAAGQGDADALLEALTWTHALLTEIGHPEADLLNRLPDPAVRRIVVTAATSDELFGARDAAGTDQWVVELDPYNPEGLTIPSPAKLKSEAAVSENMVANEHVKAMVVLVKQIAKRVRKTFKVRTENVGLAFTDEADQVLTVPPGWVTRLAIHPAVPNRYLAPYADGGVFDPGMKTLAVGHMDDHTLYDGPKLHIETIRARHVDDKPTAELLQTVRRGHQRGYALDFNPRERDRIFAEAQLDLQQWRPTGRPIYRWIEPVPPQQLAAGPVVSLTAPAKPKRDVGFADDPLAADLVGSPGATKRERAVGQVAVAALKQFEEDAFFGIPDHAVDRKQVIRLQPARASTRLWSQDWPERSATYFRHRLRLISRYARAAKAQDAQTVEVVDAKMPGPWIARTVILADPLAGELSRPQLRALFSVQQSLRIDKDASPILSLPCVLAEPPFSQLGLADRVSADVKTTNVYTFDKVPKLQVDGLRKQIGPDPRLSYFAIQDNASRQATLAVEGPVGLHFEADSVSAPALSNSQYMLHVELLDTSNAQYAEVEESFLGIGLIRYADPGWSFVDPDPIDTERMDGQAEGALLKIRPTTNIPPFNASWIDLDGPLELKMGDKVVATVTDEGENTVFSVAREVLFKDGGTGNVPLCTVPGSFEKAALLIRPQGDGRTSLAVFRQPQPVKANEVQDFGRMEVAQLFASVEFSAGGRLTLNRAMALRITRQSDATLLRWARTARDMGHVGERMPDAAEDSRIALAELTPELPTSRSGYLRFRHADDTFREIASPVSLRRYPLHVHRRLALILRRPSSQIGHQIDLYDRAVMADAFGGAELLASEEASVSLMELETRAEIIRADDETQPDSHLTRYENGHFDLFASSGEKRHENESGNEIRQIRLHLRAANRPLNLHNLKLMLSFVGSDTETVLKPELDLDITDLVETWSLDVVIFYRVNPDTGEQDLTPRWSHRLPGQQEVLHDTIADLTKLLASKAFDLTVRVPKTTPETWLDVSMLHSNRDRASDAPTDANALDFDWIFGQVDPADKFPDALSVERLNTLPEAQARIVGHSAPMPIRFHDP